MRDNMNGEKWYHESRRRVPGLWECPTTDRACLYEAEMQFKKDREVDRMVLQVLEDRLRACWSSIGVMWNERDYPTEKCDELAMFKRQADMNYATKYRNINTWGVQTTKVLQKVRFTIFPNLFLNFFFQNFPDFFRNAFEFHIFCKFSSNSKRTGLSSSDGWRDRGALTTKSKIWCTNP